MSEAKKAIPLNDLDHEVHGMECDRCMVRCYENWGHYFAEKGKPCACGKFENIEASQEYFAKFKKEGEEE